MRFSPAIQGAILGLTVGALAGCQMDKEHTPVDRASYKIVRIFEDFTLDSPGEAWSFRTPSLWRITEEGDHRYLQMAIQPERPMMTGVRRPQEYVIYNAYEFRSFALACYTRVDNDPAIRGRDACLFFGRHDNTHLYYVHLSNYSDQWHNNIIRVDGETRASLLPVSLRPRPAITDRQWHRIDVVRDVDEGTIRVWVDLDRDPELPTVFEVTDRTYEWGFIGLGSFDDHASFAQVAIEGQARRPAAPPAIDSPPGTAFSQ